MRWIEVNDLMQQGYVYRLIEPMGRNFHPDFSPELTLAQILELGVFGSKYMTDCAAEFPRVGLKTQSSVQSAMTLITTFSASMPRSPWRAKGWIYHEDQRGWFQWYCRYFLGRRCPDDERQIRRWRTMRRHLAQKATARLYLSFRSGQPVCGT